MTAAQGALFPLAAGAPGGVAAADAPSGRAAIRDKAYMSHSKLNCFLKCGKRYYFQYVERRPTQKTAELPFGSGMHKGIEYGYKQQMITGMVTALGEKTDAMIEHMRAEFVNGDVVFIDPESDAVRALSSESEIEKEKNRLETLGRDLLSIHHQKIAAHTVPVAVEQMVRHVVPGMDVPIIGFIDLIDRIPGSKNGDESDLRVVDHKTASKRYAENSACVDPQLLFYAAATEIPNTQFDVLLKAKKPDVIAVPGTVSPLAMRLVETMFRETYESIKKGAFHAVAPGKYPCTPKGCPFWSECMGPYFSNVKGLSDLR